MSNTSNQDLGKNTKKKELLSIKPDYYNVPRRSNVLKVLIFIAVCVVLLAMVPIFLNYKNNHKKTESKNPISTKSEQVTPGPLSGSEYEKMLSQKADKSLADNDLDQVFLVCEVISSSYMASQKYQDAKRSIDECTSRVKDQSKIPWFIYKDKAYIDLRLQDKNSAKINFQAAIDKYKDTANQPKDSLENLKQEVGKL